MAKPLHCSSSKMRGGHAGVDTCSVKSLQDQSQCMPNTPRTLRSAAAKAPELPATINRMRMSCQKHARCQKQYLLLRLASWLGYLDGVMCTHCACHKSAECGCGSAEQASRMPQ
jgi:hypothetical protein